MSSEERAGAGGTPDDRVATLVLAAAEPVGAAGSAFLAEVLVSTLLGSLYARLPADRGVLQAGFLDSLRRHAAAAGTAHARAVAAVLDGWRDRPGRGTVTGVGVGVEPPVTARDAPATGHDPGTGTRDAPATGRDAPATGAGGDAAWLPEVGQVRPTGAYSYGDRYGDRSGHIATFAYRDTTAGGPEHAVLVEVDHNAGLAVDVLVTAEVGSLLDAARADAGPDGMNWFGPADPAAVRAAATAYLRLTDQAATLPDSESLPGNRALALARLALLPEARGGSPAAGTPGGAPAGGGTAGTTGATTGGAGSGPAGTSAGTGAAGATAPVAERVAVTDEFFDSPEAHLAGLASAAGRSREAARYCADLVVDFAAATRAGDPLRWSPAAVEAFLLEWIHPRAVLDADDVAMLPRVLAAWVLWSGRRRYLPDAAVRNTTAAVRAARGEFERLCATGERQTPAARATARMVADGIDPGDQDAVRDWLARNDTGSG